MLCSVFSATEGTVLCMEWDGKQVNLNSLLSHLDNENCPQMMDKPKVVIIQACNGVSFMQTYNQII